MSACPSLPTKLLSEDTLATLIACWTDEVFELEEVYALAGYDEKTFAALANDTDVLDRVARTRASPHFGPFLARLKARRHIPRAVDRLRDVIDDIDATPGSIAKATELLYVISRMRSEDAAKEGAHKEPFHLRINMANESIDIIGMSD